MNNKIKTLQIAQYNTDYPVTLIYDTCKSGESQYGPWNLYGVEYNKEPHGLFVDEFLHETLSKYKKGDQIVIRREQDQEGKLRWEVFPTGNGSAMQKTAQTIPPMDSRTKDIHRQVCLKVAVLSFPTTNKSWDNAIIKEIKARTDSLIFVLDGAGNEPLSF
jgi:hypothetical protein